MGLFHRQLHSAGGKGLHLEAKHNAHDALDVRHGCEFLAVPWLHHLTATHGQIECFADSTVNLQNFRFGLKGLIVDLVIREVEYTNVRLIECVRERTVADLVADLFAFRLRRQVGNRLRGQQVEVFAAWRKIGGEFCPPGLIAGGYGEAFAGEAIPFGNRAAGFDA